MPDVSYWADRGYGSTGVLRQPTAEAPGYGYGRAVGTPSLGTVAPGGGGMPSGGGGAGFFMPTSVGGNIPTRYTSEGMNVPGAYYSWGGGGGGSSGGGGGIYVDRLGFARGGEIPGARERDRALAALAAGGMGRTGGGSGAGGLWATDMGYDASARPFGGQYADTSGLPPSRWAGINEGGGVVGQPFRQALGQASPARPASSGGGFWDWLTGTPTGFLGQALSGMAIQRGANPAYANLGGSAANVVPSIINPFLGLANTLIGAGTNYFGANYNPRYGFGAPSFASSYTLPEPSPAPQPALSGSSGGWFGGGSGWTIEETTPAF